MNIKFSAKEKALLIHSLQKSLEFAQQIKINASCRLCVHIKGGSECGFHGGRIPKEFMEEGCRDWQEDEIPF